MLFLIWFWILVSLISVFYFGFVFYFVFFGFFWFRFLFWFLWFHFFFLLIFGFVTGLCWIHDEICSREVPTTWLLSSRRFMTIVRDVKCDVFVQLCLPFSIVFGWIEYCDVKGYWIVFYFVFGWQKLALKLVYALFFLFHDDHLPTAQTVGNTDRLCGR